MSDRNWKAHKSTGITATMKNSPDIENTFRKISFIINSYFIGHLEQRYAAKQVVNEIDSLKDINGDR